MIENEQVYLCEECKAKISEKDLGTVRVHGYYRLYCPFCQSGKIKVIGGIVQ
jgi:Zn finger protein HypA/HybF involved in hydrogenase expression